MWDLTDFEPANNTNTTTDAANDDATKAAAAAAEAKKDKKVRIKTPIKIRHALTNITPYQPLFIYITHVIL